MYVPRSARNLAIVRPVRFELYRPIELLDLIVKPILGDIQRERLSGRAFL